MLTTLHIAVNTFRQTIGAGVFWMLVLIGTVALWTLLWIPFFTFKEDVKMFKDVGCALVMTLSLIAALLSASRVVDEEFETRTAVTLLSKPITDWQFLLGKYLGVAATVVCLVVLLGISLELTSFIRLWMDDFWRRRSATGKQAELWADCWLHMYSVLPCLVLVALQAVLMTAVSVSLSTRLSLAPNLIVSILIFVVGHLTPVMLSWTEYRLDEEAMTVLREQGVSDSVLGKLTPMRDRRYATAEEFDESLQKHLLLSEHRRDGSAIRSAAAGWASSPSSRSAIRVAVAVIPDLERCYNIIDTVAYKPLVLGADQPVPEKVRWGDIWRYVLASAAYTLFYVAAVITGGVVLLRRREVSV